MRSCILHCWRHYQVKLAYKRSIKDKYQKQLCAIHVAVMTLQKFLWKMASKRKFNKEKMLFFATIRIQTEYRGFLARGKAAKKNGSLQIYGCCSISSSSLHSKISQREASILVLRIVYYYCANETFRPTSLLTVTLLVLQLLEIIITHTIEYLPPQTTSSLGNSIQRIDIIYNEWDPLKIIDAPTYSRSREARTSGRA